MCILRCLSEGASNLHMAQEGMVTKTNMQLQFVVKFKPHFNIMEGNTHKMLPGRILLSYFSPQCVLKCVLKLPAWYYAKLHWLHLFDFFPPCIFKCVLKLSSQDDVQSHWLHLVDYSPLSVKCILKWPASEYASRLCVSKCLLKLCGSGHAKERWLQLFYFPLCVFKWFLKPLAVCYLDVFSKCLLRRMHYHTNCTCCFLLACQGGCKVTLTAFVCLFSTVGFKCPQ